MIKIMKLAVLLVVGVIAKHAYGDAPEAIFGGQNAVAGQFKHQVSLQLFSRHFCGGSLIDDTHVVTAAHCVDKPNNHEYMKVLTGTLRSINSDGEIHKIKCIRLHPDYTGDLSQGGKHDIAVITLQTPVKSNNLQAPIRLASKDYATGEYRGAISGWGRTNLSSGSSPLLQWTGVNVLSQADCLAAHPNRRNGNPFTNPQQICTLESYGKGACHGDSGGPLTINGELCGVASWVLPCALGVADVYTNVYYYVQFIQESIRIC